MARISSTISLVDHMTAPIMAIQYSLSMLENTFNAVNQAADIDAGNLTAMQNQLDMGSSAAQVLADNMQLIADGVQSATGKQSKFNSTLNQGVSMADKLTQRIGGAVADYASFQGVKNILGLSDEMAGITARLNMINDGLQTQQELQNKVFAAAQNSRGAYAETANMVAQLGLLAGDAFSSNNETIAFVEQLNKHFAISKTSTENMRHVMTQITQALGSGVLRGDELNSVLENTSSIAQPIADYLGIATGEIRDFAAQGGITADVFKNSILSAVGETNALFEQTAKLLSDVAKSIGSQALIAFQPFLERLNSIANSSDFEVLVNNAVGAIAAVAEAAMNIFSAMGSIAQFASQNWSIIEPIIWGVVGAMVALKVAVALYTAAQWLANNALMASGIGAIVVVIGLIIAAIVKWIDSVGGLKAAWLTVVNIALAGWDLLRIGFFTGVNFVLNLWDNLKLGLFEAGVAVSDYMGQMKVNVLTILQNMVNGAINIVNGFIGALNKIPSVSLDLIEQMTFGTEAQITYEAESRNRAADLMGFRSQMAANAADRENQLNAMKTEAVSAYSDRWDEIHAIQNGTTAEAEQPSGFTLQDGYSPYTPETPADLSGIGSGVSNIDANTKDQLNYSDEELKLWRDMAERDVINRFTTAEVKMDFGGVYNTVSSEMDLDGFVDYVAGGMEEAILVTAEGVHF